MTISGKQSDPQNPLGDLEEWDDFVKERYPEPADKQALVGTNPEKTEEQFRDYEADARSSVREFYRLNHRGQTLDFVRQKRDDYLSLNQREMGVWEAAEFLNTLIDDSDPDTDLSQLEHLLQTSEQIRGDGHPHWFVLAGFVHDLGKVLCLFGEPQWAVVGDTFPVGCAYSDKIVFPEFFDNNPAWHLRGGLRPRQGHALVGTRRIHLSRHQGSPTGRGAVHAALPLVLSVASRG